MRSAMRVGNLAQIDPNPTPDRPISTPDQPKHRSRRDPPDIDSQIDPNSAPDRSEIHPRSNPDRAQISDRRRVNPDTTPNRCGRGGGKPSGARRVEKDARAPGQFGPSRVGLAWGRSGNDPRSHPGGIGGGELGSELGSFVSASIRVDLRQGLGRVWAE